MKTLAFLTVFTLIFASQTYARSVVIRADHFVKKGIPYCTAKITRGCVKPQEGITAKYYLPPKYKDKKTVAKVKPKIKGKTKAKKLAKNSLPSKKTKQSKRDIASVLEKKLKSHSKKKKK